MSRKHESVETKYNGDSIPPDLLQDYEFNKSVEDNDNKKGDGDVQENSDDEVSPSDM